MELVNNPHEHKTTEGIERLLLAILLVHPECVPQALARLEAKHFIVPEHKALYRKIAEFYQIKNHMDANLLISFIANEKEKTIPNPQELIYHILNFYTNAFDLDEYIEIILMEATVRELKSFGKHLEDVHVDYYRYDDEI